MRMYDITIGNFYVWRGIPCIELNITCEEDETENDTVYLSAFRWYSFQVSATPKGEWDYGATPVFGLETFKSIRQMGPSNLTNKGAVKFLIQTAAEDAILSYTQYSLNKRSYYKFNKPNYGSIVGNNPEWDKFINAIYDHIVDDIELEDVELEVND